MTNPASVTHGPGLVGTFLNVFLYGIMVTQCFVYFSHYPNDRFWMKVMVATLLLADTANSVFDMWWIYNALINHFNNPSSLERSNWIFATDPAMVGIIAAVVQLFFAWRVKVLTRNWWIVVVIIFTAIISLLGGLGTAIATRIVSEFVRFQKFQVIVIIWLISTAICDTMITIALSWHLRTHKTGFTGTDDILDKIIRLTIQNGLLTAIVAIVDLVAYLATPTGLHLVFNFPLAKLYTNSLMSSLNSRAGWRYQTSESTGQQAQTRGDTTTVGRRPADVVNLSTTTHPEVFVNVETHEMIDVSDPDKVGYDHTSDWSTDPSGLGSRSRVKSPPV